jgi:hypothetical protein
LENGRIAEDPAYVTSNLSGTNQCVFGRFSDAIIGLWGFDIVSDNMTMADSFTTVLTITTLFDFAPLRGLAFVRSEDSAAQ